MTEPELVRHAADIESIRGDARDLLAGLTDDRINWREAPERWSIAECLDHLRATGHAYLPTVDAAIADARSRGVTGRGPFRHGMLGNWFVRSMEPPVKTRFKAPATFRPASAHRVADLTDAFMGLQDAIIERLQRADGLHLARVRLTSPASRLVRLSLGQAFAVLAAHERRHVWQARQVKSAMARAR